MRSAISTALLLAALLTTAAAPLPKKGEPAITAQTQKSGGVRPAEQLALRFDSADLDFQVLPTTQEFTAYPPVSFTCTSATRGRARALYGVFSDLLVADHSAMRAGEM